MGNLCSISISIENLVAAGWDSARRPANYIIKFERNQLALGIALRKLIELRNDVKRKVEIAERQQMKPLDQVEGWLLRVEVVEAAINDMEAYTGGSYCVKNFISSYKLGKKVAKKLEEVAALRREGRFEVVAEWSLPTPVDLRPSRPTVGLESKFDEVWGCLGEQRVGVIGLYGLGGVGKTTLMTQISNTLYISTHDFEVVIWAVVSSDPDPRKVQDEIWKKIGFCDDVWKSKSLDDKAIDIFRILNRKKFVLLLDDIWKWFDLLSMGVPVPDEENKSKIVFTTRSEEVCCSMGAHKIIKVECLPWGKAWDLFRSKVGEDIINSHPDIPQLAKAIANECGGLPLALITIGRAMACKRTPWEWNHAIKVLRSSAPNFPGSQFIIYKHKRVAHSAEEPGEIEVPQHKWHRSTCHNSKSLISSFSTLKVLKLAYCGSSDEITGENALSGGNETLIEELDLLENLGDLCITIKSGPALNQFLSGKSWSWTRDLCFKIFNDSSSINISFLEHMKNLDVLFISDCTILEDLKVDWTRYRKDTVPPIGLHNPKITSYKCFHSLHTAEIDRCPMLRDLTWLIFAPNLRHLFIINCESLTEVIHKGVAEEGYIDEILCPFGKLERLYLSGVPELRSIYWKTLPFHCLTQIHADGCPKLKKLPLNSTCAKEGGVIISGEEAWWNKLDWEDEATKSACIPNLRSPSLSTPTLRDLCYWWTTYGNGWIY